MEYLNYNVLPLKDFAIRKSVAMLFREPDILASVKNFSHNSKQWNRETVWQEIVENKMSDKISKLGLPKSLSKLLVDTAKLMGRHILGWMVIHEEYLLDSYAKDAHFDVPILGRLYWTAEGALDYRKTAEELICSDVIDVVKQYQLACLYCLEDYIQLFWKKLPEEKKTYFYKGIYNWPLATEKLLLQFWWPYIIRGEQSKLDSLTGLHNTQTDFFIRLPRTDPTSFHEFAFQRSVAMRNKAAAEYFFQRLTQEEKEASLIISTKVLLSRRYVYYQNFPREKVSETFLYLLSVMTPDQQMQFFQEWPFQVLACFLCWPLQDQFSEIADQIWELIPEKYYDSLLREMYISFKNSGHYFQTLFRKIFLRIPYDFRKGFVDQQCEFISCFCNVLHLQDKEALTAIFRSVDAETRAGLVLGESFLHKLRSSISKGRWDVVALCLREARLSKEDKDRLKEKSIQTRKWTRFFQFLNETDIPCKRCPEDETPTEAKRKNRNQSRMN